MKTFKIVVIQILILMIIVGVSGCMGNNKSVKETMMKYMEEKYGEEFEFVNIGTETWDSPDTEMLIRSKKFPNSTIVVRGIGKNGEISDNYVDFLMKDKIEEEIMGIASKIYTKCKVLYNAGGMPMDNSVNAEMSVAEYSKAKDMWLPITICIEEDNYEATKDENIEQLRKVMEQKQYICEFHILYVKEGKLDLINDTNINDLFTKATSSNWSTMRGDFLMDDSYQFLYGDWRKLDE